ncbi:hypothetical protein PPERSA_00955 [Pseudocohnilembus persalinus]|uniref:Uncharacterized protein n=1 Tax=Pseudocohnilembus persalinus TaxID=266149 RepID=A0A0V0R8H8_PSEPJ|nr:hypothetical protein PPERSA_00955 [Pseudocohnilembus persalinus]|eukprot:KRX10785.1 hypothetical protein PPERSA_00955 [Pseudocohnilembus persalinus]
MKGQNIASTLIFNKEQEKNRERHIHQILNVKISVPSSQKNIVKENRKKFNHLSNNRKRQQLEELSSNNILGDYDKLPSPSLKNKAQSTRGMRNFSNQNKIRSQTAYSQDFRQKMQLLYKNVRKIDGENYLVEIKVFQNKMVIKCDIIKGFESKIIEIPEDEAQDFLRVECNNQLENMISKLKIIDNKMYLIGNQADPNKIQTNRSNKYDEEQNILVNNNKSNLKNQKNLSKVGKNKNLDIKNVNDVQKTDLRQSKQQNVKNIKNIEINQDIIKIGEQDVSQSQKQQQSQQNSNNNLNSYQIQQNSSQRKSTKFNNNNSKIVEGQAGQLKVQTQEDYDEQFDEAETEKQFNSLEEQEILEQLKMHNNNQTKNKDSENDIKTDFAKKINNSKMEKSQLNASRNLTNNSLIQQQEVDLDQSNNRIQKDGSKFVQNEKIRQNQIKQQKQNERKIRDQKIKNMYNKTVEGQKSKQKQSSNQQTNLNSQQQRTNQFEEDNDNYYHDNIKDEKLQSIVQ